MIKDPVQVGILIKELRIKKELTQEQLAKSLQVSAQAISKWEKGESYPDLQQLVTLSELFSISINDIVSVSSKKVSDGSKQEYRVYERIETSEGVIEVLDIISSQELSIDLRVTNNLDREVILNQDQFLALTLDGNQIEAKSENITNYDYVVVSTPLLHKIPAFLPPNSSVEVKLIFNNYVEDLQLWINIPSLCNKKHFLIHTNAHKIYGLGIHKPSLSKDELVDLYNFNFKKNELNDFSSYEIFQKINIDILNELIIPKKLEFYKAHERLFENDVIIQEINNGEYVDWNFTKRFVEDPIRFREIVKKNFIKIEKDCSDGKCGIIKTNSFEEYMDTEIISFIIKMNAKYAKRINTWTLDYITDQNIDELKSFICELDYIKNCNLFGTKLSNEIVNQIITSSNLDNISERHIINMKEYYGEKVSQETIDFLLTKINIENYDDLMKHKSYLSLDAWEVVKKKYFEREQARLDEIKNKT